MSKTKQRIQEQAQAIISAADAGLFTTTVSLATEFLKDHPESIRAWLDLGHALTCLCRYDKAVEAYERALAFAQEAGQCPDGIYGELGQLNRQRGEFALAKDFFQRQIASNPDDSAGYLMQAALELQLGDGEATVATLTQAADCKTGCSEEVQYSLGVAYRSVGKLSEASQHFRKALEIAPKYAEAKLALKDVKSAAV